MKIKMLGCVGLFLLLFVSNLYAGWDKRPEFRWTQLYRYDLRQHNHRLYTNRLSLTFNYLGEKENSLLKLTPFFEIRRNVYKDLWERKELGIEIGKDIFKWFYLGEAIQQSWKEEDSRYYRNYEKKDYVESETRLLFSCNLLSGKHLKLKGFILDEHTYDFEKGAISRNELVFGLIMPLAKYIETGINWRHIDRVHYYDSDVAEAAVTFIF